MKQALLRILMRIFFSCFLMSRIHFVCLAILMQEFLHQNLFIFPFAPYLTTFPNRVEIEFQLFYVDCSIFSIWSSQVMHFSYYLETKETKKAKNIELWIMNIIREQCTFDEYLTFQMSKAKISFKTFWKKRSFSLIPKRKIADLVFAAWPHQHGSLLMMAFINVSKGLKERQKYTEFHILRKLKKGQIQQKE